MPKFKVVKKGHLIKGEVEFTVVRECAFFSGNQVHSDEFKVNTFLTVEEAADCARECWSKSLSAMETYKVYKHTKGKKAYSHGHFQIVNWPDYDYTNSKRTTKVSS